MNIFSIFKKRKTEAQELTPAAILRLTQEYVPEFYNDTEKFKESKDFLKHLINNHCLLLREGGNHSIFRNTINNKISSVPRHKEIKNNLVRKICRDLEIPAPSNFQ